jgi:copper chaperone
MVQFQVNGMTCGGCARSVTNAVKGVDGQAKVDVDLATKLVTVETTAQARAIADAIEAAGYAVEPTSD